MKNLLILIISLLSINLYAQDDLKHDGYVSDFADIFSDSEEKILEDKIAKFEKETEIEFAIVSVKSLEGRDIEGFTVDLANRWGVGKKGADNGLMILIAPEEREWRTEVGYGLEFFITDGYSKKITDKYFPPNFKKEKYFEGVNSVVDDFQEKLGSMSWEDRQDMVAKRKEQEEKEAAERREAIWNFFLWFLFIAGIIALIAIAYYSHKRKQKRLAELRSRIEHIKRSNRSKVDLFEKMIKRVKKLDPYNSDIENWNKTHETIVNELVILESIKTNLEEAENCSESINSFSKSPTIEMQKIITIHDDFNEIQHFHKSKQVDSRTKRTKTSVQNFIKQNMKSKYVIAFSDKIINEKLDEAKKLNTVLGNSLDIKKIGFLRKTHEEILSLISSANSILSDYNSSLQSYHYAEDYINKHIGTIPSLLEDMNSKLKKSGVKRSTKSRGEDIEKKANKYKPDFSQDKVKNSSKELESIIEEIEDVTRRAKRDKRDKDDEDRRRRQRNSSSIGAGIGMGSSFGSSGGSSFSGGSFGGGSFGGGGSSGSW
jgi:uncharacterized membrane protein YgcG